MKNTLVAALALGVLAQTRGPLDLANAPQSDVWPQVLASVRALLGR